MNRTIAPKKQKAVCLTVFALYILVVLYLTIFRFNFYYDERQLNLVPLADLIHLPHRVGTREFLRLFLGNIGWFVPFGFLWPMLLKKKSFLITLASGFLFSFFIETMQFVFYKGVAELDDLILNTLGTAIGYVLYRQLRKIFSKTRP